MTRNKYLILSLLITLIMMTGFFVPSYAADGDNEISADEITVEEQAETLEEKQAETFEEEQAEKLEEEPAVTRAEPAECDHVWGKWKTETKPTCTAKGNKYRVCSLCSAREDETISAKGHTWSWIVDKEATCSADGSKHRECSVCGKKETKSIPATNKHTWKWVTDVKATCTKDGRKHQKCTNSGCTATRNENTVIDKKGHSWKWVTDKKATCTKDGRKHQECTRSGCSATRKKDTVIEKKGHSWSKYKVSRKATFFAKGSKYKTCSRCDKKVTKTIAKKKAYNRWATNPEDGERYYFNGEGLKVKGWRKIKSSNKEDAPVKWCYFKPTYQFVKSCSTAVRGKWVNADDKTFYFTNNWEPAPKGFMFVRGDLYYFGGDHAKVVGKFKSDGVTYKTDSKGRITGLPYYKMKYDSLIYIDISDQTLYYFKDGETRLKTNVVTGKPGTSTPTGDYSIRSKSRNIYLVGATWNVKVSYWMAFIGSSYGMHDASWRSTAEFNNKKTYLKNGSHGCVNMKTAAAKYLYDHAAVGTKVMIRK